MHRRCNGNASVTSAMHWRRQRGENRAPHRADEKMHRRCGAILRPHLLGPHSGCLELGRACLPTGGFWIKVKNTRNVPPNSLNKYFKNRPQTNLFYHV
eukprot:6048023-Pyramimonas_sp.AAC.1